MDRTEALSTLGPYLQRIKMCVRDGFDFYWIDYKDFLYRHSPISRACLIRDSILHRVRLEFSDDGGVRLINKKNGLVVLEVERKYLLRFKKLNSNKCSSNIQTAQSNAYLRQMTIYGLPECTHLNAGYTVNKDWTDISGIYVTKPNGARVNSWLIPLHDRPDYQPLLMVTPLKEEKQLRARLKDSTLAPRRVEDEKEDS